jgi:uncharacterized protein with HEPN domain
VNDDKLYLIHIRESIESINQFVVGGHDTFIRSELIQAGVLYKLQTMAESTQRLAEALKAQYPQVEWEKIRGFRNRLVHGYLNVNLDIVWDIVEHYLPSLKDAVEAMLRAFDQDKRE